MLEPRVWVYFYGSYINKDVLQEVKYSPEKWEVARLPGFDISIKPRANIVRSSQHSVYGISRLERMLNSGVCTPMQKKSSVKSICPRRCLLKLSMESGNRPFAITARSMDARPASSDYIDRIVTPARRYGFPDWYVQRLESFRPAGRFWENYAEQRKTILVGQI